VGLVLDTDKRPYLTSKVNAPFAVKHSLLNNNQGIKKRLPIKSDEESSLVAGTGEISNFELLGDLVKVIDFIDLRKKLGFLAVLVSMQF
jgi:hypothetical protein